MTSPQPILSENEERKMKLLVDLNMMSIMRHADPILAHLWNDPHFIALDRYLDKAVLEGNLPEFNFKYAKHTNFAMESTKTIISTKYLFPKKKYANKQQQQNKFSYLKHK